MTTEHEKLDAPLAIIRTKTCVIGGTLVTKLRRGWQWFVVNKETRSLKIARRPAPVVGGSIER